MIVIPKIQNRIHNVRGVRVMLETDVAALFKTETQVLRLAVKLNRNRFPADFIFSFPKKNLRY